MTRTKQTARKSVGNKPIRKLNNLDIKVKRGPGRPPKELNVIVKRGPGRPPKEFNGIVKKKPGRPPKEFNGIVKRGPGRPPKELNGIVKRGPGRPPKELNDIVKRGPGRPPKELNGIVKRGPGRPPKELKIPKENSIINNNLNKSFDNNENKNICNNIFTLEIIKIRNNNNFFVGVLDSVEYNTSNSLMKYGIKKNQIFLVEENDYVYNSHIQNDFKTYNGSLDKFVESNIKFNKDCLGWYFDTCNSISTQEQGILNIIRDLNLIPGSILGFTFDKRGRAGSIHKTNIVNFQNDLEKIINFEKIYELEYSGDKFGEYQKNASNMHTFFIKVIIK